MVAVSEPVPAQTGGVVDIRSPRINPYAVVQDLIRDGRIIVSNNAVYYFNGLVYTLLGKEDIKRLIVDRCRAAVEMDGSAALIIESIYKILLSEPRICRNDLTPSQDEVVFLDGVLNLRTNEFADISPRFFATSYLNVFYR